MYMYIHTYARLYIYICLYVGGAPARLERTLAAPSSTTWLPSAIRPPPESCAELPDIDHVPDTCKRDQRETSLLTIYWSIIEMVWLTGLAPWEFKFPFPGSLVSTFLVHTRSIERAIDS